MVDASNRCDIQQSRLYRWRGSKTQTTAPPYSNGFYTVYEPGGNQHAGRAHAYTVWVEYAATQAGCTITGSTDPLTTITALYGDGIAGR